MDGVQRQPTAEEMEILAQTAARLAQGIEYARLVKGFMVGTGALLAADYLQTLPNEVRLIWSSAWSPVKGMFLLARYVIPIHFAILMVLNFGQELDPDTCARVFVATSISGQLTGFFSEALFYYQVYAFSHKNRTLGRYLICQYVSIWATVLAVQILYYRRSHFQALGLADINCVPIEEGSTNLMGITFVLSVASVAVLVVITIGIIFTQYNKLRSALVKSFIRDGIIYLYAIAALGIASTVMTFSGPEGLQWIMGAPRSATHSILACRMVLQLRAVAEKQSEAGGVVPFTSGQIAMPWSTATISRKDSTSVFNHTDIGHTSSNSHHNRFIPTKRDEVDDGILLSITKEVTVTTSDRDLVFERTIGDKLQAEAV